MDAENGIIMRTCLCGMIIPNKGDTMVDFGFFKNIWLNKNIRELIILIILIIVFVFSLSINLQSPPVKRSERVLMCSECKYADIFTFADVKMERCPKCKSRMAYAMKCRKCDYEFPYIEISLSSRSEMTLKERRERHIKDSRCPNCKSTEVVPVSNHVWRHTDHD